MKFNHKGPLTWPYYRDGPQSSGGGRPIGFLLGFWRERLDRCCSGEERATSSRTGPVGRLRGVPCVLGSPPAGSCSASIGMRDGPDPRQQSPLLSLAGPQPHTPVNRARFPTPTARGFRSINGPAHASPPNLTRRPGPLFLWTSADFGCSGRTRGEAARHGLLG